MIEINKELRDRIEDLIPIYRSKVAIECITLVLSAVCDGRQKLPGEADRIKWYPWFDEPKEPWMAEAVRVFGAGEFIALRQEEEK